ncbi:3-oxo-5-alpha-steroid 4-dehydrogenase-domain-containing protein [Boletus coccyginus]|nr:3-oxo-5-alpha-steroid 4-dehydrogenase-domain-containing protein [Boletus coccyginus]
MHPLYDAVRRVFFVTPLLVFPFQFVVDAPFGRFAPATDSIFLLDGIRAWILMEIVAPIAFLHALANTPLASDPADVAPLSPAPLFCAALFLAHYANRALLSPLRTPSRSRAHVSVTLAGILFNIVNGILLGTYLRSPTASAFLDGALARPAFWVGTALWAAGFVCNVLHDEVLLNIRRNAKAKGKARAKSPSPSFDGPRKKPQREHYGIPHGYLYAYVSYPNYLCEWVEWCGFALAAAPLPAVTSLGALLASVQPPWIFFVSEIFLMIGRAYNGHLWYLRNFPDYPKDRKVVIPYLF